MRTERLEKAGNSPAQKGETLLNSRRMMAEAIDNALPNVLYLEILSDSPDERGHASSQRQIGAIKVVPEIRNSGAACPGRRVGGVIHLRRTRTCNVVKRPANATGHRPAITRCLAAVFRSAFARLWLTATTVTAFNGPVQCDFISAFTITGLDDHTPNVG